MGEVGSPPNTEHVCERVMAVASATVIAIDFFFSFLSGIVAKDASLAAVCGGVIQQTPRRGKGILITAAAGVVCCAVF